MSETPTEELARRAKSLLAEDGVWVLEDQRELILNGWSRWAIIIVSWRVDDLNKTVYTTVYIDTPAPRMVFSDNPDDEAHPAGDDGVKFIPEVLDALRRRMLLDDLADV